MGVLLFYLPHTWHRWGMKLTCAYFFCHGFALACRGFWLYAWKTNGVTHADL